MFSVIFVFGGSLGCSLGTDKNTPLPEKSLNQHWSSAGGPLFKLNKPPPSAKAMLAEGSVTKSESHPLVDSKNIISRKIVVPLEVENRWKAVKLLIRDKRDGEKGKIQVIELGNSVTPLGSGLKVTVGPFLPNFMMNKSIYTSMGNEELNPAVQLVVEENGKIIYKGWVFKKFPSMYAFEHQMLSIKLLGAIPAVVS